MLSRYKYLMNNKIINFTIINFNIIKNFNIIMNKPTRKCIKLNIN